MNNNKSDRTAHPMYSYVGYGMWELAPFDELMWFYTGLAAGFLPKHIECVKDIKRFDL